MIMKDLTEYRDDFEKIKSIEDPDERKTKLEELLNQYRKDINILNLAEAFSSRGEIEKIKILQCLERDIYREIKPEEVVKGMSKVEKMRRKLARIDQEYQESIFTEYMVEAYRRKYSTLTREDLDTPFMTSLLMD
jgi:hypothetical protein